MVILDQKGKKVEMAHQYEIKELGLTEIILIPQTADDRGKLSGFADPPVGYELKVWHDEKGLLHIGHKKVAINTKVAPVAGDTQAENADAPDVGKLMAMPEAEFQVLCAQHECLDKRLSRLKQAERLSEKMSQPAVVA